MSPRTALAELLLVASLAGCASGQGGAVLIRPEFRVGGSGGVGYIPPPLVIQTPARQPASPAPVPRPLPPSDAAQPQPG